MTLKGVIAFIILGPPVVFMWLMLAVMIHSLFENEEPKP